MRNLIQATEKPDYDAGVLKPLRAAQALAAQEAAERALATQRAYEADIAQTAAQMQPYGTFWNDYSAGNCTFLVASRIQVPNSMGNATSWSYGLRAAGWREGEPRRGAVGVSHAGYMGHVVIIEQVTADGVLISEMNYTGYNQIDERWVSYGDFEWFYQ